MGVKGDLLISCCGRAGSSLGRRGQVSAAEHLCLGQQPREESLERARDASHSAHGPAEG